MWLVLLVIFRLRFDTSAPWWEYSSWTLLGALQYYAYSSILEQSATTSLRKNQLVGGVYLDVWGLAVFIQYLAPFLWKPLFFGLFIFPIWGAYSLYSTFYGGNSSQNKTEPNEEASETPVGNRKQRRSELRKAKKQSWSDSSNRPSVAACEQTIDSSSTEFLARNSHRPIFQGSWTSISLEMEGIHEIDSGT